MEQALNQQSSNSNMPREAQILKKQGVSISVVKSNSGPTPSTPTDNRAKQNALSSEKTPKLMPVTTRPQTVTESKTVTAPARLTDSRVPAQRVTTQSPYHETKPSTNQTRPNPSTLSENKGFSQGWSNPISSATKSQGTVSRPVVTMPVSKMHTNQARLLSSEKPSVSRGNQVILTENKNQARIAQGQRLHLNQQLIEGKIQTNQVNVNTSAASDVKSFSSNQSRASHSFHTDIPIQRVQPLKVADVKTSNNLLSSTKPIDVKASPANRMSQNAKVMADISQNKVRSNYPLKIDGKQAMGTTPIIVENNMVKSVRQITNAVEGNATRTTQCKSSSTQLRIQQNPSGAEQTAVQTKMMTIQTSIHTKMIFQNMPGTPENKVILQQGAKVAQTASDMIQKTVFDMSSETSLHGTPLTSRSSTAKRMAAVVSSPGKKKCIKQTPPGRPELINKNVDGSGMNSPESGIENEARIFNNLNSRTSKTGLTITRVRETGMSTPSTSAPLIRASIGEFLDRDPRQLNKPIKGIKSRGRGRGRRRYHEPVCLTLVSSDEDEEGMTMPFHNFGDPYESDNSKNSSPRYDENNLELEDDPFFPGVTDIIPKTPMDNIPKTSMDTIQKSVEEAYDDEECEEEEEEEEEEEHEGEEMEMEDDEIEEEEEMEESEVEDRMTAAEVAPDEEDSQGLGRPVTNVSSPLMCRSVRIGSFKTHARQNGQMMDVFLATDGISFHSPMVSDSKQLVNVIVKPSDINKMLVHFGKCLPILFVYTTSSFAEAVRKALNMTTADYGFYDPDSNDERQKKITFLIDSVTEEQRRFLRHGFLNEDQVKEVDQKMANEILVKSTPNQNQYVTCKIVHQPPSQQTPPQPQPQPQLVPLQVSQQNVIATITAIQPSLQIRVLPLPPPKPAIKLFTYPPPPQTGGIAITDEDLSCLNEGEFLNDAIIDFYLKFVFNEKLSEYNKEKTHIFSSYFFHRLTHKPERARPEDIQKNIQIRRHNQVKTWTRHVDIFSKDFIIIPVNQNVHWFLAIVCYPGLVPEATDSPMKPETKLNKSIDSVTSTDDQEENKNSKEPNSTVDGNNQNLDENSTASSNSMFENDEPDSEEPSSEVPDSSTHPNKTPRKKEVPCICIFDSLRGPNRSRIATMLREYLEVEWNQRKGTRKVFDKNTMQGYIMQCPQQTNYSDCGIYVLQYVESFFESPIPYFDSPIPNLNNWFPKEKVASKRQELKDLILGLQKKYNPNSSNIPEDVPSPQSQALQTDNR